MRPSRLAVIAPIAIGLAVLLGLVRSRATAEARPALPATSLQGRDRDASPMKAGQGRAAMTLPTAAAPPAELPRSLQGTEVDGGLVCGADGHLAVSPAVIALFDYFFSASGEESDAVIVARITDYARAHLGEPALSEALALLDDYIGYRAAARALPAEKTATIEGRLGAMQALRREHFGEAAGALFGDDERAAAVALEKSRIVQDPRLSPAAREDGLLAADEGLSEGQRAARAQAGAVLQLRADEQTLRAGGADEAEINQFRTGTLGVEAADRLRALDQERAAWKARVEAFQSERALRCAKLADPAPCESELLAAAFDEREQLRVKAILGL